MLLVLGAAPDTGNEGVSALWHAASAGLAARGLGPVGAADHGRGVRQAPDGTWRVGLTHNRRLWRGDCLRTVALSARCGGIGSASACALMAADAVLDVSGGDSFTDLYGPRRFGAMTLAKRVVLRAKRPLILLPQTLGPFRSAQSRAVAADILAAAQAVFVRDRRSEDMLAGMLGDRFDPLRHRRGPDMAVALPGARPAVMPAWLRDWLAPGRRAPVAGLNVSGLLCQQPDAARRRYGLAQDHPAQIEAAARAILASDPAMRLLLVSHVIRPEGDPESDFDAATALKARLGPVCADRVGILPQTYAARELKWIVARLDWFAGARMHATIAGFSSGVPTLGLGYSDKAQGVFEECGFGAHVADLRVLDARGLAGRVTASLAGRDRMRADLSRALPGILQRAERQMDDIARAVRGAMAAPIPPVCGTRALRPA